MTVDPMTVDPVDPMGVGEDLKQALHRRADGVEPAADGWPAITRRIERRQRRTRTVTLSIVGGFSLAAVAVAVALVTHAIPDTDQSLSASGGPAPVFRPTTTVAFPFAVPTTVPAVDPVTGEAVTGDDPPFGPTTVVAPGTGSGPGGQSATTARVEPEAVYPETAAVLETISAQVAEGHQPWWVDPGMVAASYLGNRGLTTSDAGAPVSVGEPGALRYTADGIGGWVTVAQMANGSIYYVSGSHSDRIVHLKVVHQGDRLAVDLTAAAAGKVVVRTKRPGGEWNQATTQTVAAGKAASLTVQGSAGSDLIVQVRHEGDDGKVVVSDQRLSGGVIGFEYHGLDDASLLGPSGLGPVRLGMSLAEAARVAGVATTRDKGESCTSLSLGRPAGVALVSTAGEDRVDVITVDAPGVRTDAGVGVGNTVAEVRQAYPGIEERLTINGDGRMIHHPDDPALADFEMVFGMADGRVSVIWSGSAGLSATDELCA